MTPAKPKRKRPAAKVEAKPADNAAQAVIEDREASHGDYAKQSAFAQGLKMLLRSEQGWNNLTPPMREAIDMMAVKFSRIFHGDPSNPDHWLDLSGYSLLVHNQLTTGNGLGVEKKEGGDA